MDDKSPKRKKRLKSKTSKKSKSKTVNKPKSKPKQKNSNSKTKTIKTALKTSKIKKLQSLRSNDIKQQQKKRVIKLKLPKKQVPKSGPVSLSKKLLKLPKRVNDFDGTMNHLFSPKNGTRKYNNDLNPKMEKTKHIQIKKERQETKCINQDQFDYDNDQNIDIKHNNFTITTKKII